jgi:hypothetical protein
MSKQANITGCSTGVVLNVPLDEVDQGAPLAGLAQRRPRSPRPRRRFLAGIVLFLGPWLVAALALVAIPRSQAATHPYAVAGLRAALAHDPSAWSGRVVRVQGILEGPFVFCGAPRPCPPRPWA